MVIRFAYHFFDHRIYRQITDTQLVCSFTIFGLSFVLFIITGVDTLLGKISVGRYLPEVLDDLSWYTFYYSFFILLASIIIRFPTAFIDQYRQIQPQDNDNDVNWRRDGF